MVLFHNVIEFDLVWVLLELFWMPPVRQSKVISWSNEPPLLANSFLNKLKCLSRLFYYVEIQDNYLKNLKNVDYVVILGINYYFYYLF